MNGELARSAGGCHKLRGMALLVVGWEESKHVWEGESRRGVFKLEGTK